MSETKTYRRILTIAEWSIGIIILFMFFMQWRYDTFIKPGSSNKTDTVFVEVPVVDSVNLKLDSISQKFDCGYLTSQTDMNICSYEEFKCFDSIMNVGYQEALKKSDGWYDKELKESQEKFLQVRESNMAIVSKQYEGGTIRPLLVNMQAISDTKERIIFLEYIDGFGV